MPAFLAVMTEMSSGGKYVKEAISGVKEVSYNLASMLPVPAAIDVLKR